MDSAQKTKAPIRLTDRVNPGDRVWWRTISGHYQEATFVEWDNGTAIVRMDDGSEKGV